MSKIRQALRYEHDLLEEKIHHEHDLRRAHIKGQVRVRKASLKYERKITDGQFTQLDILSNEHRQFHEREHLLYENAIDKAASTLATGQAALQADIDRFRNDASKWMTLEQFDREHRALTDKTELAIKTLQEKLEAAEKVDVRQSGIAEATEKLTAAANASNENSKTNRRWLITLAVGLVFSTITSLIGLITLLIHLTEPVARAAGT